VLDLIRQMLPAAVSVELQHGTGRVRHLLVTTEDGGARPCVLRRAPLREWKLCQSYLNPAATGAPTLLGAAPADRPEEAWLLLEALPELFPDFSDADQVAACYRHLAQLHLRHIGDDHTAEGPWALSTQEIEAALERFPETTHLTHQARLLTDGPATLVQGDYHRWNILLVENRVRVLDWEHASFAPPIWDLALLAPEEPGWDGAPRGAMALHALVTYHEAGPLARLPFHRFLYLQTLARIAIAARWAHIHATKAGTLPPGGARSQVEAYAQTERARAANLAAHL